MARTRTHGGRKTRRRRVMSPQHQHETAALRGAVAHAKANLASRGMNVTGGDASPELAGKMMRLSHDGYVPQNVGNTQAARMHTADEVASDTQGVSVKKLMKTFGNKGGRKTRKARKSSKKSKRKSSKKSKRRGRKSRRGRK